MSTLPAQGGLTAVPNNLDMKTAVENLRDCMAEVRGFAAATTLTIASGAVTPPDGTGGGTFFVETEGGVSADDLTYCDFTNVPEGRVIRFYMLNASHVPTFAHGAGVTGEFLMEDSADWVPSQTDQWIEFQRINTSLVESGRGYGTDKLAERAYLGIPKAIAHNTLCPHSNLVGVWATNATATYTADELVLEDVDGNQVRIASFNKTANLAASGAGGLDTGSEASSTWYRVWAIAKADGTQSILLSTSTTIAGLTFPSGYSYAGRIGVVRNKGSSNLMDFDQIAGSVSIDQTQVLVSGTLTTPTSMNTLMETCIPPEARKFSGFAKISDSSTAGSNIVIQPRASGNVGLVSIFNSAASAARAASCYFEMLMPTPQTAYYSVGPSDTGDVFATGFEL